MHILPFCGWMMDHYYEISPVQQEWPLINVIRTPPRGLSKTKSSPNKESMMKVIESFLSGVKEIASNATNQTSEVDSSRNTRTP